MEAAAANQEGGDWVVKGEYVACHRGIKQTRPGSLCGPHREPSRVLRDSRQLLREGTQAHPG